MVTRRLYGAPVPLGRLHTALEERQTAFHDQTLPASELRMDEETGRLRINSDKHKLQPQARKLLANKLRVPDSYLNRCPNHLAASNLNYWLERNGRKELFLRFEGDEVRAVLSSRFRPVDHLEVIREAINVIPESTPVRYELSALKMVAQVLQPESQRGTNGHELFGGLNLSNSEVGFGVVQVQALVYRVICLNGLIMGDSQLTLRRRHTRDPQTTLVEFRNRTQEAWKNVGRFPGRLGAMQGIRVPQPLEALERIAEKHELRKLQIEAVQTAYAVEPGNSLLDVINAFTRAGNSRELALEDRTKLQEVGGRVLALAEQGRRWL